MKTFNKTNNRALKITSVYLISGLLLLSSVLLLAEKHDHDEAGHKETVDHSELEEKEHADHGDHAEDKEHDEHDEHGDHEIEGNKGEDGGHGHGGEEVTADVELTVAQRKKAGIETLRLKKQSVSNQISALSEVKLNQYKTIKVSPSITTRVEKRHVRLGDQVKKGDLLATLHTIATTDISANVLATADLAASSAELNASIAEATGELAAATATWNRIRSLGKDAVSGKRFTEAKITKEQAQAKLAAYGKSKLQVKKLLNAGSKAVQKHFELRAEQAGMVIKDDFVLGQVVNPEDVLFEISDMDHLWVEANVKPNDVSKITIGAKATIQVASKTLQGKVIFIGRILNEKTRTLPVRIEVNTKGASLYPGQFVKTSISSETTHAAIAIPAESVLRSADGDWMLFVEEVPGRFVPKEVVIVENLGETIVVEGVEGGTTIVSKGAFFVQSELAKSSFSVHNH